jgi:hypothetical protein
LTDVPDRLTAALADRYRIERELGQGGMATVYLAEDLRHRRKVALKVLKPRLAAGIGGELTSAPMQVPGLPLAGRASAARVREHGGTCAARPTPVPRSWRASRVARVPSTGARPRV